MRKSDNQRIAKSPYYLGSVIQDDCFCPEDNLTEWYKKMNCNQSYTQIEVDMNRIESPVDLKKMNKKIKQKYNKEYSHSLCNYVILNNKVSININLLIGHLSDCLKKIYRKCYGKYVDFKTFSDSILLSLIKKVFFSVYYFIFLFKS